MTEPADETVTSAVFRVAVRLPTFWPDRPTVWFAQAEAQFDLAEITRQGTKFNYVVSQLNQQQAAELEDIITSPAEQEPYDRLKAELVRQLSTSRKQHVRQLLSHEELGDRKPSQFLRHLKGLEPDVPDDFLRTIGASRLPPHVQAILAGQTEGSLDSASHLADKICEVTPQPTTAIISPATPDNTTVFWSVLKSSRARSSHCEDHTTTASRSPEDVTARCPETAAALLNPTRHPTTSAGTTVLLGTKPECAPLRAPSSSHTPASRKTPPADVNGG
jgi:hypothetical protein